LDGFRKGNAPEKMIVEKFGEMYILGEGAEIIIDETYGKLIEEHKLNTIGQPNVSIVKLAEGNPLIFKILVALMPKAELPDYKDIAKGFSKTKKEVEVEDKEIQEAIEDIQKHRAHEEMHQNGVPHTEGDEKDMILPEVNDEFVKTLGNFENVEDFKIKLKENILNEKRLKEKQKVRLEIVEKIIEKTKIAVPAVLIEAEQDKLVNQFKGDLAQYGMKPEDYLVSIKKTEEDLRNEWKEEAEKRAKMNIVLAEIAIIEKLEPNTEEVELQSAQLTAMYTDLDPLRARAYVSHMLTNEEVFKFLETSN
jgi:FKBP-type peptidyl-prolyl cis-trans isomerase (trigger factor)